MNPKKRTPAEQLELDNRLYMIVAMYGDNASRNIRDTLLKDFDALIKQGANVFQVDDEGHKLSDLVDAKKNPELMNKILEAMDEQLQNPQFLEEEIIIDNSQESMPEIDRFFAAQDEVAFLSKQLRSLELTGKMTRSQASNIVISLANTQFEDIPKSKFDLIVKNFGMMMNLYSKTVEPEFFEQLMTAVKNKEEENALTAAFFKAQELHLASKLKSSTAGIAAQLNPENPQETLQSGSVKRARSDGAAPPLPVAHPKSPTASPPAKRVTQVPVQPNTKTEMLEDIIQALATIKDSNKDKIKAMGNVVLGLNNKLKKYNKEHGADIKLEFSGKDKDGKVIPVTLPFEKDAYALREVAAVVNGVTSNFSALEANMRMLVESRSGHKMR